ncbi:hypothetical protein M426DRAFT_128199 [Hypoxylon sp. CI-4A]|nr:hypothetical protein M426DRAFT_128199 [Hypoxylon sp. CI-4A]
MAPITTAEDPGANKRKGEFDENGKRKRTRRERRASNNASVNAKPSKSSTANKINGSAAPANGPDNMEIATVNSDTQIVKKKKKHGKRGVKLHEKLHEEPTTTWKISKPMGGRMLDIDPILTEDEKHMILAYNTSIQVYSTADSLLLREIPLQELDGPNPKHQIVSIYLSPSSPNHIWIASSAGHLWLVDWTDGTGSTAITKMRCSLLCDMSVERMCIDSKFRDVPLVSVERDESWQIMACDVKKGQIQTYASLLSQLHPIYDLRSVRNGYAIVASSERDVLFGLLKTEKVKTVAELGYEFFTLDCNDEITCLDVRATDRIHLNRKTQKELGDEPVVEVVVGCARGAVFFYNDLVPQIRWLYNSKGHKGSIQPRRYHWHRRAVHAVKWSRDGNYIISGGSEMTLVLWQLDTQKMDFLPHLSATIENIVVSNRGSSYVLHLDDNSAMILSTAEMKPTTYISGIQSITHPQPASKDDMVRRVGQFVPARLYKTPAAINPTDPSRIHISVGNGLQISYSPSGPSQPMIQTLDLATLQGISKQALSRTNPTDRNTTSQGYSITEPRITDMAYSADGKWLATTDEWQPPSRDVSSLGGSPGERREVYLKFWAVSSEDQSLELVSRINAPHYTGQSEPIYSLAADPRSHRFATIGEDGVVRLWEPTVRQRDGVLVKGKLGRQLHNWACSQTIYLQENEEPLEPDAVTVKDFVRGSGAVSFSEDGSTLVCAIGTVLGSTVHVIDAESGKIRTSVDGLITGDIRDIRVLSTSLIVLSDRLVVYDLVSDELLYAVQLRPIDDPNRKGASILTQIAVDYRTSTFAVVVSPGKTDYLGVPSELAIFTPDHYEPVMTHKFSHPILSLVPSAGSSGYLVLDSIAQLWSVSEGTDTKSLAFAQPLADLNLDQVDSNEKEKETRENGSALVLLTGPDEDAESGDEMDVDVPDATADDHTYPVVVPPQKLSELFDIAPAFAMPPIEDMFYQVTKLFSTGSAVAAS